MRPPFDQWAPTEIARLQDQINALQRALDLYTTVTSSNASSIQAIGTAAASGTREVGPKGTRRSKYESLFVAFEKEARPLSHTEMIDIALGMGIDISRDNMRSIAWSQKNGGRAYQIGDSYQWGKAPNPPAPRVGFFDTPDPPAKPEDDDEI